MGLVRNPPPLTEEIERAIERDDLDAVVDLAWRAWYPELARYALARGVDRAEVEEVVADAFSLVVEGWARFDRANLRAWLFTILSYVVSTWRATRQRARRRQEVEAADPALYEDSESRLLARSDLALLFDFVDGLDPQDRMVLAAACGAGEPGCTPADLLSKRTGDVLSAEGARTRLFRLRRRLRQLLEGSDE